MFHENETYNFIGSGRTWYGEEFSNVLKQTFNFSFPNITGDPVYLKSSVAARSTSGDSTYFYVKANGKTVITHGMKKVGTEYTSYYARNSKKNTTFIANGSAVAIQLTYNANGSNSGIGWLNFLELNARRNLKMSGDQMMFRDKKSIGAGNVAEYSLTNANSISGIWEITNHLNVKNQKLSFTGSTAKFTLESDSLRSFIAYNGNSFFSPVAIGKIGSQNLHAIGNVQSKIPDMIILTHPNFKKAADNLAKHHSELRVNVIQTPQLYNEFSSGRKDVTAIRDFMKMLYDRAGSNANYLPKYLCLFGDGS